MIIRIKVRSDADLTDSAVSDTILKEVKNIIMYNPLQLTLTINNNF